MNKIDLKFGWRLPYGIKFTLQESFNKSFNLKNGCYYSIQMTLSSLPTTYHQNEQSSFLIYNLLLYKIAILTENNKSCKVLNTTEHK